MATSAQIRGLLAIGALWLLGLPAPATAELGSYAEAWQTPFSLKLPEPLRSVVLPASVDVAAWAEEAGIEPLGTRSLAGQQAVSFTMSDVDWASRQETLCDGTLACETQACQQIQLQGDIEDPDGNLRARVVRKAPPMETLPAADDGEAGSCRGPVLALPLQSSAAGAQSTVPLNLDIDLRGDASSGAAAGPAASSPPADAGLPAEAATRGDAAQPTEAGMQADAAPAADPAGSRARSTSSVPAFDVPLELRFNPLGGKDLSAEALPADTGDWELVASAGCRRVQVPLDSLVPAQEPLRVLAVLPGGGGAAIAAAFGLTLQKETVLQSTGDTLAVLELPAQGLQKAAVLASLALDPRVSVAQPDFIYRTTAAAGALPEPGSSPGAAPGYSDPLAGLSYGPALSGAVRLHQAALGGGQRIAVIDTGVDAEHPELAGRVAAQHGFTDEPLSGEAHGTAVAAIIAARANNGAGAFGVAPSAEILALKACDPIAEGSLQARCWTSTLVQALDRALQDEAGIINMSLAGPPDELLGRYVRLALDEDRLVVAGAGNGGAQARPGFPAALPGVLAVTAVDVAEGLYDRANRGDYIDLAAPGVDIFVPAPDGTYPPVSGTSMAAAHVSAVAALIAELNPLLSASELRAALMTHVRDLGEPGRDGNFGAGLVDACLAASRTTADAVTCAAPREVSYAP